LGNGVLKSIENEEFINSIISKYLEFWQLNILNIGKVFQNYFQNRFHNKVSYCKRNFNYPTIGRLIMCNFLFQLHMSLRDKEDKIIPPYCGPKTMKVSLKVTSFIHLKDLHNEYFTLAQPLDPQMYLI
jgi:hypothetical protein